MTTRALRHAFAAACALALAACAAPPVTKPAKAGVDPGARAMVAAIRAAGGQDDTELAVQPLRDPMVEDLREQAQRVEAEGRIADAAAALDHALRIVPDDPALLQERAEAAVLLGDLATAEAHARRAWELGGKVGPLCRRHQETVRLARIAAGDGAGAVEAQARRDACTVAAPARY